ncbi:hypothetical protein K438DRAFT_1536365, partial [Mycena galopus ATCC 62051]
VMNFMTHDKAFSLYPWSTFVTKQALVVNTGSAGAEEAREKYIKRGWKMIRSPTLSLRSELGVVTMLHSKTDRSVGDSFTWTISL